MSMKIIETTSGQLTGIEENGCLIWRGIPYAKPPVGPLRWKKPVPVRWEGVRHCDSFSRKCPQNPGMMGMEEYLRIPESEDCLYLNITAPSSAEGPLPVLFWIHGGGFLGGTGNENVFQSPQLVKKGVILVTINYRLGVFGFLSLEELAEESGDGSFGNYGIEDQIAALAWVKENIAAFGGDPEKITIFGQSAGGVSVLALMESPAARGLFAGAVVQSGSSVGRTRSSAEASAVGRKVLTSCGASSLEELRRIPAEKLLEAAAAIPGMAFVPSVDGVLITEDPGLAFMGGRAADVPVIMGTNADEALFSPLRTDDPAVFESNLKEMLGDRFGEFCACYPGWKEEFSAVSARAGSDYCFALTQTMLESFRQHCASPVYQYYFADRPRKEDGEVLGATHSAELNYLFGHLELQSGTGADGQRWEAVHTDEQRGLAELMSALWAVFARTVRLPAGPEDEPEVGPEDEPEVVGHKAGPEDETEAELKAEDLVWLPFKDGPTQPVMHFVSGAAGCRVPEQQKCLDLWKAVICR